MTCDQAQRGMLLADGGGRMLFLQAELEDHLAACPACRAWRADQAAIRRLARQAPLAADAPPAVVQAALDRARRPLRLPRAPRWMWPAAAAAAALLFVLGAGFLARGIRAATMAQQAQCLRIDAIHALAGILAEAGGGEKVALPDTRSPQAMRQALARQLLILHEMEVGEDEAADALTAPEALPPTTLRERNSPAENSKRCV